MTKYKLLKDCPHGKAGSVWDEEEDNGSFIFLHREDDQYKGNDCFPKSTFSDWFEEIKSLDIENGKATRDIKAGEEVTMKLEDLSEKMRPFTKEQVSELRERGWSLSFGSWLDENTEK